METTQLTAEEIGIINRIADLMEEGSKDTKQCTGRYMSEDGCVCALGAVLKASGISRNQTITPGFSVSSKLGLITWPKIAYPDGAVRSGWMQLQGDLGSLPDVVICLNDAAGWDFTHIIGWLRSVARQASVTSEPA